MVSTLHLTITGRDTSQRLQKVLTEGESVRIGRAPQKGWAIPWDPMISREHANLSWDGKHLRVVWLETAQNPVMYQGKPAREARLLPHEWFQIGQTTFQASSVVAGAPESQQSANVDFEAEPDTGMEEHAYSQDELKKVAFRNTDRQMEMLSLLPGMISTSHSDEDLGRMLSQLLLDAIPQASAVAVAHFDETELPTDIAAVDKFPQPLSMRVQTRDDFQGRFSPSRRMFFKCLTSQSSVMHIWGESSGSQFTVSEGLGWAFCSPIKAESSQGWSLYVSGKGSPTGGLVVTEDDLSADLRFTQLVAQFIGSIRQVRMLQEQKTQLSSFFSPKVIEGLTDRNSRDSLAPAERDISVLFCDVRGFSKKSEALQGDLLTLLKSVSAALGVMAGSIVERDGAIADFQGDAALGFWGWPLELPDGPVPACRSALNIYRAFKESLAQAGNLLNGFSVGMGIAHGRALAGQIGTNQQAKVGVFGPVVNQGSRLEGMTKQFSVPICVDEATAEYAKRFLSPTDGRMRRLARVRPKGMDTAITVFSLMPPESEFPEVTDEMIANHDAAVEAIIDGKWNDAIGLLEKIPADDGPKQFLLNHMAELENAPPPNWDGAFSLSSK